MTRYIAGTVLLGLYAGWVLYRLLIREDLAKHMDEFRTATFFVVVMLLVYWMIVS